MINRYRLRALCAKETKQILRDPSSFLIAVVIPLLLLFIFGYGINLDASRLRIGILMHQKSQEAHDFINTFTGSPFIEATISDHYDDLNEQLTRGKIRGIVVIPTDFSQKLLQQRDIAPIQVLTDGSEPNTANFVQAYTQGIWQTWLNQQAENHGTINTPLIEVNMRYWFNPAAISQNFIIPGAISIIMTVVGAILTSLVIAREWERGTMESLLATEMTRAELLLSKLLPYQLLGMFVMALCMVVSRLILRIPFHGSFVIIFLITALFLATALGIGLLISTITRNQFNAAMIALNAAFLPAIMLSGFIFEIDSMPAIIRMITYLIPARYFVSSLQTLFLAGNVYMLLFINSLFLLGATIVFIGLTALKTQRRLD